MNKINRKEFKAWLKLYKFLEDLNPKEWQQFKKATTEKPLFKSKRKQKHCR